MQAGITKARSSYSEGNKSASFFTVYRWCLAYLKPYYGQVILFLCLGLIQAFAQIAFPKGIQFLIDDILPHKDIRRFAWVIGGLTLPVLFLIIANALQQSIGVRFQEKAAFDMQLSVFRKMRELGFSYYEKHPVGETLSLFQSEIPAIQEIHRRYFPSIIRVSILLIISLFFLISISPKLSLIFIPSFLVYMVGGPYFEKKSALSGELTSNRFRELNRKQYDSLSALLELRTLGRESWDLKRLIQSAKAASNALFLHFIHINLRGGLRRIAVYLGGTLLFIYGFYLIREGQLSLGEFVGFTLLFFRVIFDLTILLTNLTEQKVLMIRAQNLYRFMISPPDVQEAVNPVRLAQVKGQLEFDGVDFCYLAGTPLLQGFELNIHAGEKIALVGTSGGGKSTIAKLIGRFYDPNGGEIRLDGVPIRNLSLEQLRQSVGYVFQETYLFGMNIRDNIRFGNPTSTDEEIEAAAKAAYAHDFIMELPNGYETQVGERGTKLSGGQKQRIAIARMLIKNPVIVVLDEATSALDSVSETEVIRALRELTAGRTTIAIAHRLSTIVDYDRIVYMEDGQATEIGTYTELMAKRDRFYALVEGRGEE
ncbi:ABC transporter ATP-binding protein [Paenibacillus sp. SYP-B3998]|uniref:ABC transporter ATP-binding protein n=1 Tax=Paenibacillus sp. SYP-B3998 TaxID=2678564 RepID=A0A6G4A4S7_9BACL|nr:ABC transporter ATP-binding protein [Paenibacillus sp. SYP-B3998]NEW09382.1 ABC transporter ATP-binding protein [Paenibacillus sp. SYP-B3998]